MRNTDLEVAFFSEKISYEMQMKVKSGRRIRLRSGNFMTESREADMQRRLRVTGNLPKKN